MNAHSQEESLRRKIARTNIALSQTLREEMKRRAVPESVTTAVDGVKAEKRGPAYIFRWILKIIADLIVWARAFEAEGLEKHVIVRETLKALFVGPDGTEKDWEELLDRVTPFHGLLEHATDAAGKLLKVEDTIDDALDPLIIGIYGVVKGLGFFGSDPREAVAA